MAILFMIWEQVSLSNLTLVAMKLGLLIDGTKSLERLICLMLVLVTILGINMMVRCNTYQQQRKELFGPSMTIMMCGYSEQVQFL